jgi:hypothetical protein
MNSNEANYTQADDDDFWLKACEVSLNLIWDNPDDDIYAELLDCGTDSDKL